MLLKSSFLKDWKNGADHVIPVNMSFNILKYISISPNINYHERWNFKSVEKSWDTATNKVINDTINGFNRYTIFNAGVSASTKFYGFFTPNR
jgi:hypothetical protein